MQLYARRNDDNRRMLSAWYIYTRDIYTKISVILPGTKAALVLYELQVEFRRRRARIYLAARFRFRRHEKEEKRGKKQGEKQAIFSTRKSNAGNTRERSDKKGALSSLVACFLRNSQSSSSMKRPRKVHREYLRAWYTNTSVHPRDTHVRKDEAWHTHVRDECVLEMWTLFPRELRVDTREEREQTRKRKKENDKANERGREREEGKRSACFCVKELFFHFSHPRSTLFSLRTSFFTILYLLNVPFLAKYTKIAKVVLYF